MKILPDESLPRKLKAFFGTGHEVYSVRDMGWLGEKKRRTPQTNAGRRF